MARKNVPQPDSWVDQHGDALYRYALFRIRDNQIAEDLVQETFLVGLRAWESFAGRSSVRTWLFGILKQILIQSPIIDELAGAALTAINLLQNHPQLS